LFNWNRFKEIALFNFGHYEHLISNRTPARIKMYQQYANVVASLSAVKEPSADKVGCASLALTAPVSHGGRPNKVFRLKMTTEAPEHQSINYMELVRSNPWGVFHTSNVNYILGVATQLGGPLINQADGHVEVPL